ncbi:trehalase family glycosidase [Fulvivirgaceae bacterium BMA10]|uniref:Trehalase family glycosidase n=1 Tax=Splendidivirga corallicola TaxID=3051826 RepID=A0ABT8KPL9_9BACT|nr:trehalase family glycosidase [Fulvivirgaceae bacterium BMA10]
MKNRERMMRYGVILGILYIGLAIILVPLRVSAQGNKPKEIKPVNPERFAHYIDYFNSVDNEPIQNAINNENCWNWMLENIPWFECPNKEIEQIYYYRWWVFRKHIKQTPKGYVITEFLPEVGHSAKYNTIACAAGLHIDEGRWLRNKDYISDYIQFWFSNEGDPRQYSSWFVDAIYRYCKTIGDFSLCETLFDNFIESYKAWENSNKHRSDLFWSYDDRDGGEHSISGSGLRPTLNSYLYADAIAISKLAEKFNKPAISREFKEKAEQLKNLVQSKLWDEEYQFFNTIPLASKQDTVKSFDHSKIPESRRVRELYGYFPWKFLLPEAGYEKAWLEIKNEDGFLAPYGPTTAEQRHPLFMKNRYKRCQWDGSSWPFATSLTIGAMINLIRHYDQDIIEKQDFLNVIKTYTQSQYRTLPYGEKIPWIGESLHPSSGIWLSRAIALEMDIPSVKQRPTVKDKNYAVLRGKDYNHSSYCDLIISGLVGLEMGDDGFITVDPLIPNNTWAWFRLDGIEYAGKRITIIYDKTGKKYNQAAGLSVFVDGKRVGYSKKIKRIRLDPTRL